jgi:hypothetical protein
MKANNKKEQIIRRIGFLKKELLDQKEKIEKIEKLTKKQIDCNFEVDLWELSEKELDQEMGNRLSMLNEDIDCTQLTKITSHRKVLKVLIVALKKNARKILLPFLIPFFEKQKRFNEGVVAYHLASFIRFRSLEQRLRELEKDIVEINEKRETIGNGIESSLERQKKNDTERKR